MIRKSEGTDINAIADIWLDTNRKAHNFIPAKYWEDNFKAVKEMLSKAEIYVYVEEEAGSIQGFIGLDNNYIEGIFVCSTAQSGGIGKQLLDFVKEGRAELILSVYKKNARAVKFYNREGFTIHSQGTDENTAEKEYTMVWKRGLQFTGDL